MRVIAGKYKGRVLKSVRDPRVRPATDRVKESIFNILQNRINLHGARVLDLFAGSGSLGFEAISRGAIQVTFVDQWEGAIKAIKENINLLGCPDICEVIKMDVYRFLRRAEGQHELVFVDPPYKLEEAEALPQLVFERGLVSRAGFLVFEHATGRKISGGAGYQTVLERTFGATIVSFLTPVS